MALLCCSSFGKATIIVPEFKLPESLYSFLVAQYGRPIGLSPLLKVLISLIIRSIPSSILKSLIGIPCIATLYQDSPFLRLVNKGNTPLIVVLFCTKNSELNLGVVLTTIFPLIDKEIVETTSPYIPFLLNTKLSKLYIDKVLKELAYTLYTYRRVYLLERTNLLGSFSLLGWSLVLELDFLALIPVLLPLFLDTRVYS